MTPFPIEQWIFYGVLGVFITATTAINAFVPEYIAEAARAVGWG